MKPNDVYNLEPIHVSNNVYQLEYHFRNINFWDMPTTENPYIQIKRYYDPYIDGERIATMGAVFIYDLMKLIRHHVFCWLPVMVFQHAGRGGRDFECEYITDKERYIKLENMLRDMIKPESESIHTISPDEDCEEMAHFYGHGLRIDEGKIVPA